VDLRHWRRRRRQHGSGWVGLLAAGYVLACVDDLVVGFVGEESSVCPDVVTDIVE
jgi:hypothetical protein